MLFLWLWNFYVIEIRFERLRIFTSWTFRLAHDFSRSLSLSRFLSSYTLIFSQKLDILSFIIYFLYFFGLFSPLTFMKLKSFFIDVFLTLKIIFNKVYFYVKSFAIWFFIFLVFYYFSLVLYTRQRVTLLIQNQSLSQRKHHSDILYGSGSTRRGRPSTTIRNYCR